MALSEEELKLLKVLAARLEVQSEILRAHTDLMIQLGASLGRIEGKLRGGKIDDA